MKEDSWEVEMRTSNQASDVNSWIRMESQLWVGQHPTNTTSIHQLQVVCPGWFGQATPPLPPLLGSFVHVECPDGGPELFSRAAETWTVSPSHRGFPNGLDEDRARELRITNATSPTTSSIFPPPRTPPISSVSFWRLSPFAVVVEIDGWIHRMFLSTN